MVFTDESAFFIDTDLQRPAWIILAKVFMSAIGAYPVFAAVTNWPIVCILTHPSIATGI